MTGNTNQSQPAENEQLNRADKPRYVFTDASELPRSKPDYIVISPTPLGLRAVPVRESVRGSLRFVDRVRAIFRRTHS